MTNERSNNLLKRKPVQATYTMIKFSAKWHAGRKTWQ